MPGLSDLRQPQRRGARGAVEDLPAKIIEAADLAIDGGTLTGLPSTVVDLTSLEEGGDWTILRDGALSRGDLAACLAGLGLA